MAAPKKTAPKKTKSAFDKKVDDALSTWATVLYVNYSKEDWRANETAAKALWGDDYKEVKK